MSEVLVLDMTSEEDTSVILQKIGRTTPPRTPGEDSEELVHQAMAIGALAWLLETRSSSLAQAVAAGRRQGENLAALLSSRGISNLLALLKR